MLIRNTILNLAGNIIPLAVGLITIPYLVRGLGVDAFGILAIAWALLIYFSLLDFGMGRATNKFVAEFLGRNETNQLPALLWTSLIFLVSCGIFGALLLGFFTSFLVDKVLRIPPLLIEETRISFLILAGSLPVVLASNGLRGALEGGQRFDLVNAVKIPADTTLFLLPVLALHFGSGLPGIVLLLVLARCGAAFAYLAMCLKVFPALRQGILLDFRILRLLSTYGGWIMVSNVVGPILIYMERFFIGAMISASAVGYYSAPFDAMLRVGIISSSISGVLFPAFSRAGALEANQAELSRLFARAVKWFILLMGPLTVLIILFAPQLLGIWLGMDFAEKSTPVLRILAIGVMINSLASIAYSLLQGLGRPDLTAKFHLIELPFYAVLVWFLIGRMGITGAALAWSLRVGVDAILLFGAGWWLRHISWRAFVENGLGRSGVAVTTFAVVSSLTLLSGATLLAQALVVALLSLLFVLGMWSFVLDDGDRRSLIAVPGQIVSIFRGEKWQTLR